MNLRNTQVFIFIISLSFLDFFLLFFLNESLTHTEFGDRKQEVVIIGIFSDEEREEIVKVLRISFFFFFFFPFFNSHSFSPFFQGLDACLVTDDEWRDLASMIPGDTIARWQEHPFEGWDKYMKKEGEDEKEEKKEVE